MEDRTEGVTPRLDTALARDAGIEVPLICGAMYPCSNPELVAAVSVVVGEDDDPVLLLARETVTRVGVALGDPDAAAIVEREANRLLDVRFAGKERHLEAIGHAEGPGGLFGRRRGLAGFLRIEDLGKGLARRSLPSCGISDGNDRKQASKGPRER